MRKLSTAGLGLGAGLMWAGSRLNWLNVAIFDDKSGDASYLLTGAVWSTELTAVVLLLLAAVVAALALRRVGRTIVAIIATLAAIAVSWQPLNVLLYGASPERVKDLLTSGAASQQQDKPVSVAEWATISNIEVSPLGPIVTLIGCAIAIVAGIVLAIRPGTDGPRRNAFERKQAREEKLSEDLAEDPTSSRLMWDALDADVDPTTAQRDF